MPASSLREEAQATVSNKHGHRGEREVSRKTIARGMPGRSGVTVVTTLVCLFFYTRGCGRIARPAFPAPSDPTMGRTFPIKLARKARRDREAVSANVRCLKIEIRLSSSAKADDPVFQRCCDRIQRPRRTGCPAFAGHDGRCGGDAARQCDSLLLLRLLATDGLQFCKHRIDVEVVALLFGGLEFRFFPGGLGG